MPAMRVMVTRRGRPAYPATAQRPLTDKPPTGPAAVMLWDTTRRLPLLALDFDAKNGHGPRAAATDATDALRLLTDAGLHPIADRGPTGGWHIYARLPQPAAAWDVRQVAAALARRWPTLDPSPLLNVDHGCIRPPGAPHKVGGHQRLVGPLEAAVAALEALPDRQAWTTLRNRIGAAHAGTDPSPPEHLGQAPIGLTRRAISTAADQLARTGQHPHRGFDSPSEARYSVICSAVAAGWTLADVETALRGPWTWLRTSYGTKHHTALLRDWRKARNQRTQTFGNRTVRIPYTSQQTHRGGTPNRPTLTGTDDIHLALRKFTTHSRDHARANHHSPVLRAVMHALIWAAHVQGRYLVNIGVRSLAEQAAVSHVTVATALHTLAETGLISRVSTGRGRDADVWRLHLELATHAKPARGRRHGLRPVFRVLGRHLAGETYELLTEATEPLSAREIALALGYDRQRIHEALALLAGHRLATHTPHTGWTTGPADPNKLARHLGGWTDWHNQHQRHKRQRAAWHTWLERHQPTTNIPGQLALELHTALNHDEDAWIAEYANGTSPPPAHLRLDA
ncbi:MAG: hypothetical protein U0R23_12370 [Candidatus Nanopelagicales bacterium]